MLLIFFVQIILTLNYLRLVVAMKRHILWCLMRIRCGACYVISTEVKQNHCIPVVAVYPTWSANQLSLESIPWDKFTHITLTFILPNTDASLQTQDMDQIIDPLVKLAHEKNKKVLVSVGGATGYGDAFQKIATDKNLLNKFTQSVNAYVVRHQIDGVDIDWEYWTKQAINKQGGNDPVESSLLVDLLAALRAKLPKNILMTTDIFAGYWYGEQYLPEIQQYLDYVVLMAYDFTGAWKSSPITHHSDYATFKKSIKFVLDKGFKKEKLLVGFPTYGIEFIDGRNIQVNKDHSYKSIVETIEQQHGDYKSGKIGHLFFETPELVRKKSQYILEQQLAGVLIFELTQDTLNNSTSLLSASNQVISPEFCSKK
jgi:chitinase